MCSVVQERPAHLPLLLGALPLPHKLARLEQRRVALQVAYDASHAGAQVGEDDDAPRSALGGGACCEDDTAVGLRATGLSW